MPAPQGITLDERTLARLCAARHRLGLTHAELAKKMHVSRCVVQQIETGKARPSLEMLDALAAWLGYSVEVSQKTTIKLTRSE